MKIDYKHYPILEKLYKGELDELLFEKDDVRDIQQILPSLRDEWKLHIDAFKTEIVVSAKPFIEAVTNSLGPLGKLFNEEIEKGDFYLCGTYIIGHYVTMIDYYKKKDSLFPEAVLYVFDKSGTPLTIYESHPTSNKEAKEGKWASRTLNERMEISNTSFQWVVQALVMVFSISMFRKYASVETKFLSSRQKRRDISCLYRNITDLDITYLDSKWFTTLVKSEGFNVRGHFRLQPKKKDGKWTRELIWINEFHKTGYTAPARKLHYNEERQVNNS